MSGMVGGVLGGKHCAREIQIIGADRVWVASP